MNIVVRRWRLTIGYAILVIAVTAALFLSVQNQDRIEEQARTDAVTLCQSNNELKTVIITMIERLAEEREPTDFTKVSGFDNLETSVQDYLKTLSLPRPESPGEDRTISVAREVLVPIDCPKVSLG